MFEAGLFGTLEDIGLEMRNTASNITSNICDSFSSKDATLTAGKEDEDDGCIEKKLWYKIAATEWKYDKIPGLTRKEVLDMVLSDISVVSSDLGRAVQNEFEKKGISAKDDIITEIYERIHASFRSQDAAYIRNRVTEEVSKAMKMATNKIPEIENMRKLLDIMEKHLCNELTSQDVMYLKESIKNWDENVAKLLKMFDSLSAIDLKTDSVLQDEFSELDKTNNSKEQLTEDEEEQVLAFVENMVECVDDFIEKINAYESEEELYESLEELSYPEQNDYGSYIYEYPSKAKVKVACKEKIESLVDSIIESYERERKQIVSCTADYYSGLKDIFYKFIDEFSESYEEYMSLECEGIAEEYLMSKQAEIFRKDILCEKAKEYDFDVRFNSLIKERFGNRIEKLIDMKKYFSLCEYDEEDGYYCYIMEKACDAIYEDVYNFLTNEMDIFPKSVFKVYKETIIAYCDMLKGELAEL